MKVKQGDTVRVHYTGKLSDGSTFDSSENGEPLEFTVGGRNIIPGFEKAVEGMEPGEEKTEKISHDQAYGQHRDELVFELEREQLPPELDPEAGQRLQLTQRNGQTLQVTVTEVNEQRVKLDANHPLAGQDLTFTISVVDIVCSG